jgi:hypothetical protein
VSRGWKITVAVLATIGVLSTPLVWTLLQRPSSTGPTDQATRTGNASRGGITGIRRPGGRGRGTATVERTGEASGENSVSGIDYSD